MSLPFLRADLLHSLTNPNLAVLLVLVGILLIYAEFNRPGTILLGSCGAFALMLGIYGLAQHPLRPLGLLLLIAGLALLSLEVRFNTRNILAAISAGLLILGLIALIPKPFQVNPLLAFVAASFFTTVTLTLARIALRARRNKRPRTKPATHPSIFHGVD